MNAGREIDKAIDKMESEIRMLKMRVAELADEELATVAAEADDLHPVARLLAEAYRLALQDDDIDAGTRRDIRLAWSDITGVGILSSNDAIVRYGLPKC